MSSVNADRLSADTDSDPVSDLPLPPWPSFAADEREAVDAVLRSGKVNYWTGTQVAHFEREYADSLGLEHAVALMNGTVALELALRMWNIGAGDEVIVTPRSFIASASCAAFVGARPVFADVDRDSGNLTAETISRVITPRTRAIIPVHLAGWPCEMDPIMSLANEHGVKVLEDCAQAHGAYYSGRPVGSIGHAAAFSFCQDKIITTGGEGGMLVMNDGPLWSKSWSFKDHGKSYEAVFGRVHPPGFRWLHDSFGTNWRLTEIQAAIGRLQLRKLSAWTERRRRNASLLISGLSDLACLRIPVPPQHVVHSYYKCYAFLESGWLNDGWSRDRIVGEVNDRGIPCFSGSCSEVYLEKAFDGHESRPSQRLSIARELGESSLMFLVHPTLEDGHMERMIAVIRDVLRIACRNSRV
jgi:dTDP-4-amino-4,6-dideoxygalactose transaminase